MSNQEAVQEVTEVTPEAEAPAIIEVPRNEAGFVESNLLVATRQPIVAETNEAGEATKVGKELENITLGAIPYSYPTLDQVFTGFPAPDSFTVDTVDDGEGGKLLDSEGNEIHIVKPVYKDTKLQYVMDSLREKAEQPIRAGKRIDKNELGLVTGWEITKPAVISWPQLLEVSRGSGYSYMEEKRDATNLYKAWLETKAIKPAQAEQLVKVFRSPETIANMAEGLKTGLERTVEAWKLEIDEEALAAFTRHLGKITEGLTADVSLDDFDDLDLS